MTVEDRDALHGRPAEARRYDLDLLRAAVRPARHQLADLLGRFEKYLARLERRIDELDR